MGKHHDGCKPDCNDSHDRYDHNSEDYGYGGEGYEDAEAKRRAQRGGCFIATAVYGDVMAPEVVELRSFRDNILTKSIPGRVFISIYYTISPPIARWLKTKPPLASITRSVLDRLVKRLPR